MSNQRSVRSTKSRSTAKWQSYKHVFIGTWKSDCQLRTSLICLSQKPKWRTWWTLLCNFERCATTPNYSSEGNRNRHLCSPIWSHLQSLKHLQGVETRWKSSIRIRFDWNTPGSWWRSWKMGGIRRNSWSINISICINLIECTTT